MKRELDSDEEELLIDSTARIWRVKVPKFLGEKIAQCHIDGRQIGTMKIVDDNITLHIPDNDIPQNYRLKVTNDNVKNEYIFTEKGDKIEQIAGRVLHEAGCMPIIDEDYRKLIKSRNAKSQLPVRKVQRIDDKEGKRATFVSGNKEKIKDSFSLLKKRSNTLDKRERMPKGDLLNVLFSAFEQKEYWQFKAIADHSNQPHAWLKEVLNDICTLNKGGPYANHFSLKDEFKSTKTE